MLVKTTTPQHSDPTLGSWTCQGEALPNLWLVHGGGCFVKSPVWSCPKNSPKTSAASEGVLFWVKCRGSMAAWKPREFESRDQFLTRKTSRATCWEPKTGGMTGCLGLLRFSCEFFSLQFFPTFFCVSAGGLGVQKVNSESKFIDLFKVLNRYPKYVFVYIKGGFYQI